MQEIDNTLDNFEKITDASVIAKALERVTNSPEFKDSKRSQQFLNYIVEKYLAGNAALINGTTIAQDVLGAGADFDSATNPIVRVQAGRLRSLLSEYYRSSGKNDDVLIYVAKGQYAPEFGSRSELRPIISASRSPRKYSATQIGKWVIAGLVVSVILISILYGLKNNRANVPQSKQSNAIYPSIAILPFQNLTNDPSHDVFKQGFQHQLGTDLSRFRYIRVVYSDMGYEELFAEENPIADYVLEGTFLSVKNDIDLIIKLIKLSTGETISQNRIKRKIDDDSYFNALVGISANISSKFAELGGDLGTQSLHDIKNKLDVSNHHHANLQVFECLSLFHKFETERSAKNFNHAAGCLQYQVSQNKTDSTLLAALAWVTTYGSPETGLFINYPSKGDASLNKALKLSEQAIAFDPGDSLAYQYMSLIQWRLGQHDAAIQSMRRSMQLNPAASGNLANLGGFLCYTGDWEAGLKASREALKQNSHAYYWYYTPLFMRAFLDRNASDAMLYAKKHNFAQGADGGVYVLIAASMSNDTETIQEYTPLIKAYASKHGGDPLYVTRRWVQSPMMIKALEEELGRVGIPVPKN